MTAFFLATVFLIITPGPGVLSVAGVGSGYGFGAGQRYLWGLFAGNFAVGLAVASGLAAVVFSVPFLRQVLMFASAAYLVWLAVKIALSGATIAFTPAASAPGFADGIMLQTINPKTYAVNTALFTGFAFLPGQLLAETAIKFGLLNVAWVPIHFAWLWAGVTLKRLNLAPATQRAINIAMALAMLAVAGLAVVF